MVEKGCLEKGFHPIHYDALQVPFDGERILVACPTPKSKQETCPIADKNAYWVVGKFVKEDTEGLHYKEVEDPQSLADTLTMKALCGKLPGIPRTTLFRPFNEIWAGYAGKGLRKK